MAIVDDYFYDTEFWERGPHHPIDLISIGMKKRTVGWGYYAVNSEFDLAGAWHFPGHAGDYWLRENVLKQLPLVNREGHAWRESDGTPMLDPRNAAVKTPVQIRADLERFMELEDSSRKRRLWAWYADYDHVVLSQIWGTMAQLPRGMPMFTHDLKQVVDMAGNPPMPDQLAGQHHALDDAAHLHAMWEYCLRNGVLQPPRAEYDISRARPVRDNPQA
jgi:hypothetical protein